MSSPPPASSNGYNQIRLSPDKAAQPAAPQKWGRAQWMVLTLCMLAYAAVCSELLVFVYIQSAVTTEFRLNAYAFPLLPVATTIVSMLCGPVWGGLADKLGFGRQRTFLFAAAVASLACVASAFAPSFAWLLALRCAATVGGTGLTVVLFVLMAEASPPGKRGKALVILTCAGTAGVLYVAGVAWGLSAIASPAGTWLGYRTWRWLTLAAAIPVVASLGVRLCVGVVPLPHPAEQRALVQATSIPEHTSRSPGALVAVWRRLAHLLAPRFRRRSLCLCVVWFCAEAAYWGTTMYLPTYLNTVDVNPYATLTLPRMCSLVKLLRAHPLFGQACYHVPDGGGRGAGAGGDDGFGRPRRVGSAAYTAVVHRLSCCVHWRPRPVCVPRRYPCSYRCQFVPVLHPDPHVCNLVRRHPGTVSRGVASPDAAPC